MTSNLVSAMGTGFELLKRLTEATINHGGSETHLRYIMSDPGLASELAKKIVGPIWDLVEKPVSLEVDWESSIEDFCSKMPTKLIFHSGIFENSQCRNTLICTDPKPEGLFHYRLMHWEDPVHWESVQSFNPAGFRELCTYITTVDVPSGFNIGALGSYVEKDGEMDKYNDVPTFMRAIVDFVRTEMSWIRQNVYKQDWFFLVRIPVQ